MNNNRNTSYTIKYKINNTEYEHIEKSHTDILIIKIELTKGSYKIDNIKVFDNRIISQKSDYDIEEHININKVFDNIYLLNLEKDKDKYENSKRLLNNFNIKFERFEATDGSNLVDLENMNRFALGCLLSHIRIIEDAKKNNYEKILILEDDIMIHKNFHNLFSVYYNKIDNWKLLYFGCSQKPGSWYKVDIKDNYYKSIECNGTFAYAVDNSIYDDILECLTIKNDYVDTLLHNIQSKYNCYTFIPNLIIADVSDSIIRGRRDENLNSEKMGWELIKYIRV